MVSSVVYMDHAATAPLRPEALEAMLPFLQSGGFGNASSAHRFGQRAQEALEQAREQVAAVLNCRPSEIVFTSGGTESVNAAIKGVAMAQRLSGAGNRIVTSTVEHDAVIHTCQYLEKLGFEIAYLPVDRYGLISPEAVAEAIDANTALVSIMLANNEVGTIEPVEEIAAVIRGKGRSLRKRIPFHTDAVQAPGLLGIDVENMGVDLLSLSAHKFGGPKGVGGLYVKRATPFLAQQSGGGQERQRRAGTENVAGIAGMGVAISLAESERESYVREVSLLRDKLMAGIELAINGVELMGHPEHRLANNVHFAFDKVKGDELVAALDAHDVAASAGSACGTAVWEPSHVLLAMGLSLAQAAGGLRLTLGAESTSDDVDYALSVLPAVIEGLRESTTANAHS